LRHLCYTMLCSGSYPRAFLISLTAHGAIVLSEGGRITRGLCGWSVLSHGSLRPWHSPHHTPLHSTPLHVYWTCTFLARGFS
jgi:hypothetical protein